MKKILMLFVLLPSLASAGHFSTEPVVNLDFEKGDELSEDWTRTVGIVPKNRAFYTSDNQNIIYENGMLNIEARKQYYSNKNFNNPATPLIKNIKSREISSASIVTRKYIKYGKIEVVAKTPMVAGLQSAIWLQGKNQGQYGEIDIMEAVGAKRPGMKFATIYTGLSASNVKKKAASIKLDNEFHKYSMSWTPEEILIAYDAIEVLKSASDFGQDGNISPLHQPMQLRLNLAVGTEWSGPININDLPQRVQIKSIKIWSYE